MTARQKIWIVAKLSQKVPVPLVMVPAGRIVGAGFKPDGIHSPDVVRILAPTCRIIDGSHDHPAPGEQGRV
jgi:hypothetical protein